MNVSITEALGPVPDTGAPRLTHVFVVNKDEYWS